LLRTQELVNPFNVASSIHEIDVASREAVEGLASAVFEQHGAVHVLINNAGVSLVERVEAMDYEDFAWVMNINFWGVVYGTKSFLPYLRQSDEAHIVNISSLFGLMSVPLQSAYNASKFAVRGFTESLKMELAGSSVGVSCVHPGGIDTDITRNSRIGEGALDMSDDELHSAFEAAAITSPEKAAKTIIRGVEKNRRRILIGADARLADWFVRHFPGTYEKILRLEKDVLRGVKRRIYPDG
jgi:short-subunit dehydrogenase